MSLSNLSLKSQLYLAMISVAFVVLFAGFSYNIFSSYGHKKASFIHESELQAGLIADNAVAPIMFFDQDGLNSSLAQLDRYPQILRVYIYLNDGSLYGKFDRDLRRASLKVYEGKESWFLQNGKLIEKSYMADSFVIKHSISLNGQEEGYLLLEKDTRSLSDFLADAISDIVIFSSIMLLITMLIIYTIADKILKPIIALSEELESLSKSHTYESHISYNANNEIGKLYKSFDSLLLSIREHQRDLENLTAQLEERVAERTSELESSLDTLKKAQKQLVESEKMASLGSLVSGVAHEVNTPLGNAVTGSTMLKRESETLLKALHDGTMKKSTLVESLEHINETSRLLFNSINTAASLIRSFKQISVDQSIEEKREFDVVEYLREVIKTFNNKLKHIPVKVTIDGEETLFIRSYPGAFAQLLNNFIQNAIIHGFEEQVEGAEIRISLRKKENNLEFIFSDNGAGMSEEIKEKAFDPFVTTKRNAGGTGLGLNIAYNIVTQKLGGQLELETQEGKGTTFRMNIPL